MRGLTRVRDSASTYPFVAALVALAADVKSDPRPGTKVTYAADWSEYFGHQPADGSGDVYFHLDPLWSSADIDAIGIDVYWPLADWRDGTDHSRPPPAPRSIYDLAYLTANIAGGEGYDWYYASAGRPRRADPHAHHRWRRRQAVGVPLQGPPLLVAQPHFDRPGGIESGTPTAWVPQSKPFWFTELGCPAVDKGANQPNVFVDPKSSELHLPYFSRGTRDDFMQRRYLQAFHECVRSDARRLHRRRRTRESGVYAGRMVDLARMHVYTWDARPYPRLPRRHRTSGATATTGGSAIGSRAASPARRSPPRSPRLLADHGFADYDAGHLTGALGGLVVDRVMSARDALQPLELAFFFDTRESDGAIVFAHRGPAPALPRLDADALVETSPSQPRSRR